MQEGLSHSIDIALGVIQNEKPRKKHEHTRNVEKQRMAFSRGESMTTPNRKEIFEKALALWHEQHAREGDPSFVITPEYSELLESGFVSSAISELMRSESNKDVEFRAYSQALEKPEEPKIENFEKILEVGEVPFDVSLAVDSGFYVSGTSQSGKTNLAKLLVQQLIDAGIACFVLDASKAWTHDSPIDNVIDVNEKQKEYAWEGSTVFDISSLAARKKVLFVNTFCHDIYEQHVEGYERKEFIIFEEAQTYLPQGSLRLAIRRSSPCESVLDVVTVGANYGLRFGLITQFPALVDKPPVKICQQRYFGWTWEKNDVAYVKAFLGKDWIAKLQSLQKGEFIYQCRDATTLIKTDVYKRTQENLKGVISATCGDGKTQNWYEGEICIDACVAK